MKKITSDENKPLVDEIVSICNCPTPSRRKITYKQRYNNDCNASITKTHNPPDYGRWIAQGLGKLFKKDKTLSVKAHETYEIHNIDVPAIQEAFREFKEEEHDGWRICCNKRMLSFNCSELIAHLLINNGGLISKEFSATLSSENPANDIINEIRLLNSFSFRNSKSREIMFGISCFTISLGLFIAILFFLDKKMENVSLPISIDNDKESKEISEIFQSGEPEARMLTTGINTKNMNITWESLTPIQKDSLEVLGIAIPGAFAICIG